MLWEPVFVLLHKPRDLIRDGAGKVADAKARVGEAVGNVPVVVVAAAGLHECKVHLAKPAFVRRALTLLHLVVEQGHHPHTFCPNQGQAFLHR